MTGPFDNPGLIANPMPWLTGISASFRGKTFSVEVGGQAGGRRNVTHEFPERDTPFIEDLGRRTRRWQVTGYIVCGPMRADYRPARDDLIAACEAYGPGTLVHPTLGSMQVNCDSYSVTETKERGGIATFEMVFVEAGSLTGTGVTVDTQGMATTAGANLASAASNQLDTAMQSSLASGTIRA